MTRLEQCSIVVIGSINMDLAVRCPRIPAPGETVLGSELRESPGGKGANQATAASRLGGRVAMVGCLGADAYAVSLRATLDESGVNTDLVCERGPRSGVALIEVGDAGDNSIVVVPAANEQLTPEDVRMALDRLPAAGIMLLQLEVPLRTVGEAARLAKRRGITVILDPAPVQQLPGDILRNVDILTPNEGEAAALAGHAGRVDARTAERIAASLHERGAAAVLLKLGGEGIVAYERGAFFHEPGIRVTTVDTTAAGDCLAGALAAALDQGLTLREAVHFANAAAALSTTRPGAQSSMPNRQDVQALLNHI